MRELKHIMYSNKEVLAMLLKAQGITTGHWMLSITFGLHAQNVRGEHEGEAGHFPAALIPVLRIGIKEQEHPTPGVLTLVERQSVKLLSGPAPQKKKTTKKKTTAKKSR